VTAAGGAVTRTEYLVDPPQAYAQVLEEWGATAATGPLPDESLSTTYVYGDDLISQTKLALAGPSVTSVYHYDGLVRIEDTQKTPRDVASDLQRKDQ
jgi:hypothetical protein